MKDHLLIIRFSALGDIAMAVPVVASLARQYPDLRITVLSRPFARVLFEGLAPNVGFMGADIKKEYAGLRGMNALYRRLVAKNITAVADFHNILRSNYLRLRFNLGHYHVAHINKHRRGKHRLTRNSDKVLEQQPTSFHNYLEVLARLGYTVEPTFTSIFPPEGGHLRLLPHVIGEKKKFQQWIGIAPFAAHKGKIYPEQNMEKVIVQLIQRHPSCRIFLFGGGGDEKVIIDGWAEKYKNCVNASAVVGGLKHGQCQYALSFAHRYARCQHLGSHPSLRRFHGLASESRQCHRTEPALSSVFGLRQQTLSAWRLCLFEEHITRNGAGKGGKVVIKLHNKGVPVQKQCYF